MHPSLHHAEYIEVAAPAPSRRHIHVTSYNVERGRHLDAIIDRWHRHPASRSDIVLLSEADHGMARSGNRHVARDFAAALGYSCAYAVEFIELTKGDRRERRVAGDNQVGHIGNAIVSRYPLRDLEVVRLPAFADYSQRYLARVGSRMAVVADVGIGASTLTVASVHLESRSSPSQRAMQMQTLLEALRSRDRGQPIVVAGDVNTSGLDVNRLVRSVLRRPWLAFRSPSIEMLEKVEPVFALLRREGYEYRDCNLDEYTLRDRGYRAHLDWFFIKNVERSRMRNAAIYRAFEGRRRFSDHVPIAVELL